MPYHGWIGTEHKSRLSVFEASNDTLKEFYVCASAASLDEVMRSHCARPPAPIRHWAKGQSIFYTLVEANLDPAAAAAFLRSYAATLKRSDWKIVVESI